MAGIQLILVTLSLCAFGGLSNALPAAQSARPSHHGGPKASSNPLEAAQVARYIVHKTDWLSIASISVDPSKTGYPAVGIKSFTDGPVNNSTGIPYLYMTDLDPTAKDLIADERTSILATLASTNYCQVKSYDTQDPRCPKVFITGKYENVDKNSDEYTFAREALFERHPVMKTWPENHGFHITKVVPSQIDVFYHLFGGRQQVDKEAFFSTEVTNLINSGADLETILKIKS